MPLTSRFLSFVRKTDSCWLWLGALDNQKYGMFWMNGKTIHANRASYVIFSGEIGQGLQVCHSCDNPTCVRPEHLFLGTAKDNAQDRENKGRGDGKNRKGTKNPLHKLSEAQVLSIRQDYIEGISQPKLARKHSVNQSEISRIVNKKRYAIVG